MSRLWIRNFGKRLKTDGNVWINLGVRAVSVVQRDEFWDFTQKNGVNFGFGWLSEPKNDKLFPFLV